MRVTDITALDAVAAAVETAAVGCRLCGGAVVVWAIVLQSRGGSPGRGWGLAVTVDARVATARGWAAKEGWDRGRGGKESRRGFATGRRREKLLGWSPLLVKVVNRSWRSGHSIGMGREGGRRRELGEGGMRGRDEERRKEKKKERVNKK